MPIPIIPLIAAGSSILGNIINTTSTSKNNQRQREWSEQMYARQRADSLADWNMQNEYNSPAGQMARLRAAKLNPNLVYGHGADAQAQGPVRSSSVESWHPQAPQIETEGLTGALMSIYDTRLKEAQTNNLEAQNTNIVQDTLLKAAQTIATNASSDKTSVDTQQSEFNLQQAKALQPVTLEKAQAELSKVQADTKVSLDENERRAAQNAQSLAKGIEEILTMRAQRTKIGPERDQILQHIRVMKADERLKELDRKLKASGVQPHDPLWARLLAQVLQGYLNGTKSVPWKIGTPGDGKMPDSTQQKKFMEWYHNRKK